MRANTSRKGFTLIELMIVVAIAGILVALGAVAYKNQVIAAQKTYLEKLLMDIRLVQERMFAEQGTYFPAGGLEYTFTADTASDMERQELEFLFGISKTLKSGTILTVHGGRADENCMAALGCPSSVATPWYVIRVERDLNTNTADLTTVYTNNEGTVTALHVGE